MAVTELFNGSSWTEVNDLQAVNRLMADFGTATAAVSATGSASGSPAQSAKT